MKSISKLTIVIAGSLLLSLLYSCIKEGLADPAPAASSSLVKNTNIAYRDSGCSVCSENKEIVLAPANFFGPYSGPGIEMNSLSGRATISDPDIQSYKKINVSVTDVQGWETPIPFHSMATDGSYESIFYKRGSSVLMIFYVRFNKSTNTFTFKPVNNLKVKYGVSYIN